MTRFQFSFVLFLLISTNIFTQKDYAQSIMQAETIIQKVMKDADLPGLAVAVSVKGDLVWSEGFGFSDVKNEIPVSAAASKFRIGSVSKPLTAYSLALLFQEGKVDLDAPIQQYVPDFPKKKWDISLRHLGGHTAGIRHYKGGEFMSSKNYPTVKEGLDIFKNDPLLFKPGSRDAYSSYGWNLISAAVENIAEQPFLVFMEKSIFEPLQLENTRADHALEDIENRTKFYQYSSQKFEEAPFVDNSYKWAGGGFLSSAEDLIKFGNAFLYGKQLNKETMNEFIKPQILNDGNKINYGIGFRRGEDKKGRDWIGHSGGSVGGTTMWMIFPEQELVVAIITNIGSARWKDLAFRVSNQFLE